MPLIRPNLQSYTLPTANPEQSNKNPVSASDVGNLYTLSPGQSLTVSPASDKPRQVTLANVGSVPLVIAAQNRMFPTGLRLSVGDVVQIVTSSELWVMAPATDLGTNAYRSAIGYVSVSIGI